MPGVFAPDVSVKSSSWQTSRGRWLAARNVSDLSHRHPGDPLIRFRIMAPPRGEGFYRCYRVSGGGGGTSLSSLARCVLGSVLGVFDSLASVLTGLMVAMLVAVYLVAQPQPAVDGAARFLPPRNRNAQVCFLAEGLLLQPRVVLLAGLFALDPLKAILQPRVVTLRFEASVFPTLVCSGWLEDSHPTSNNQPLTSIMFEDDTT